MRSSPPHRRQFPADCITHLSPLCSPYYSHGKAAHCAYPLLRRLVFMNMESYEETRVPKARAQGFRPDPHHNNTPHVRARLLRFSPSDPCRRLSSPPLLRATSPSSSRRARA